jgi:hypothetical protein
MSLLPNKDATKIRIHDELYIFEESAEQTAKDRGLVVLYPRKNELFLDIDTKEQKENYFKRKEELLGAIDNYLFDEIHQSITSSSSGEPHCHIILKLYKDGSPVALNDWQRVALQFTLSSDPIKEILSVYRILAEVKNPSIFFQIK